jgi:hypothetical protein
MTITRELTRRAECCCYLAHEIESGSYSLDVVQKAEGEIRNTRYILRPFVLKDQEIEEDEELLLSHFHTLTIQYQKVVKAGVKVIEYWNYAEENATKLPVDAHIKEVTTKGKDKLVVKQTELCEQMPEDTMPQSQMTMVTLSPPGKEKKDNNS